MDWYRDSLLCLSEAKETIAQIEKLEVDSIHDAELLHSCKPKIKNCLENLRSPLDFVAKFIFDSYCKDNYSAKELKRMRVYYPINNSSEKFAKCIDTKFKGLNTTRSEIVEIFESTQPYSGSDQWLEHLNTLVNENKHNRLSYSKIDKTINIGEMSILGNTFSDITMVNVGIPLIINGEKYDLINNFPPEGSYRDISAKNKMTFKDLDLPVIEALNEIYDNILCTVNTISKSVS